MNKIEQDNLLFLADKYQNICMSIDGFTSLLAMYGSAFTNQIEPITEPTLLRSGNYATLFQAKIWVAKHISSGMISVSNENIVNSNDEHLWSPQVPLELASSDHIERLANLKALW